eukprot:6862969-Pyramimonas_sp.AAC.1
MCGAVRDLGATSVVGGSWHAGGGRRQGRKSVSQDGGAPGAKSKAPSGRGLGRECSSGTAHPGRRSR